VIDFGISRAVDATQLTRTNAVIGTPGFMAPEQIVSSREAGPAADVFSLGCVLVFAATGQGPFGAGTTTEVLYRAVHAPPQLDDVPDALRPLLVACLDKDPDRRPGTSAVLDSLSPADSSALLSEGLRSDIAEREAHAAVLVSAPPMPMTPLLPPPSAPEPGGPGTSRRRFLWIAAAGGTAATAAGVAAVIGLRSKPGGTPGSGASSSGGGTTIRPTAGLAAGPKPQWSVGLESGVEHADGRLRLMGSSLVHWDKQKAVGYDTTAGSRRWTASPRMPSGVSQEPQWLAVHGSMLYGTVAGDRGYLLGLDEKGTLRFSHPVMEPDGTYGPDAVVDVLAVAASVALISSDGGGGFRVHAVDLAKGSVLWSRKMTNSTFGTCSDGHAFFLRDDNDVLRVDARTGRPQWTVHDVFESNTEPPMVTAGGRLLVTGTDVRAFSTANGRKLWTAAAETTELSGTSVHGGKAYVSGSKSAVVALDVRDGSQLWRTASPVSLNSGTFLDAGPSVSASVVTESLSDPQGFIVLRATDGKPLWAHRATGGKTAASGSDEWKVLAVGSTVYAASATTLSAFRSDAS
ncbi:outer membrane protein assembly factor BamB family protein, partial [Streptomyces beijiangensis]